MLPGIKGIDDLALALWFIVPGVIIAFVRAQLLTGRLRTHADNILSYLVLSLVYYGLTLPLIEPVLTMQGPLVWRGLAWIALTLVGPAALGLLLGAAAQREWSKWCADKLKLRVVHYSPTAWDWRFSRIPAGGIFVMVTLADGKKVAGLLCFASSDSAERDLYLEEEWDVADDGKWTKRPEKVGILISAKEIRYVELWEPKGESDERQEQRESAKHSDNGRAG
ncbi:MAG: DUF6338 family protein [Xanthobacteraceae bacterium]